MLKDIVVSVSDSYPKFKEFNGATNCISVLYFLEIKGYFAGVYSKIIIDVTPGVVEKKVSLMDVLVVHVSFDFDSFWEAKDKKKFLLDFISSTMIRLAERMGWDASPLQKAYDTLKSKSLDLFLVLGKRVGSPNRKLQCQLGLYYEMSFISLVLQIFDAKSDALVGEKEIIRTEPHDFFIAPYVGRLKWKSNEIVLYSSKDGSIQNREFCVIEP